MGITITICITISVIILILSVSEDSNNSIIENVIENYNSTKLQELEYKKRIMELGVELEKLRKQIPQ